jgi:hypothetical protein
MPRKSLRACMQGVVATAQGWRFPPFIVVERGESLQEWQEHVHPDFPTIIQVLMQPCHVDVSAGISIMHVLVPPAGLYQLYCGHRGPLPSSFGTLLPAVLPPRVHSAVRVATGACRC